MEILVHGIARHVHTFSPSAPPQTNAEPSYSISVLVPKSDAAQCQKIQQAVDAEVQAKFPHGMPAKGDTCWFDLASDPANDPRLHNYMQLTLRTKAAQGQPPVINMSREPILNPADLQPGSMVYVNGNTSGYTIGTGGVKCYLNATMVTGEKGNIDPALLSSRPSVDQMFANIPQGGGAPVAATPPAAASVAPPPAAPTPPPAAPQAVYQMTDKAAGATREAFIANGWTDEQLIANGYMLPPGGVTPSFMG